MAHPANGGSLCDHPLVCVVAAAVCYAHPAKLCSVLHPPKCCVLVPAASVAMQVCHFPPKQQQLLCGRLINRQAATGSSV
jgi:hypothetical protein